MQKSESGFGQTGRLVVAVSMVCLGLLLGIQFPHEAGAVLEKGHRTLTRGDAAELMLRLRTAAMEPTLGAQDYPYHSQPRHLRDEP